jgi:serine O-acetyltransferase
MSAIPAFNSSLSANQLAHFVETMLINYLPDGQERRHDLMSIVAEALQRVEHCFSRIHRKYYNVNQVIEFNHLNSDHLAVFLYFLANSVWKSTGDTIVPSKLFYLNKILNGLDLYYAVTMPDIFMLVHPVGSVIGNANYKDYLVIYQNCTVGADAGIYPRFGEGVILYSGSSVLGDSTIGDNVTFGANAMVVNTDIPQDTVVVGQFPHHRLLDSQRSVRQRLFETPIL